MDETHVNWWMDDTSHWHRGFPPAGWWQAEDGRWHPPGDDDEPTGEMQAVLPAGAAHLAGDPRSPTVVAGWGWPPWARIAVLTSIAILAVVVVAAAAITDSGGDGDGETVTGDVSTTVTPSTSPASTTSTGAPPGSASSVASASPGDDTDPSAPPTTARSTTTAPPRTSAPTTTSPPPTSPGVRQGEACSPEGATAVTQAGVPMTCTTQKCHGVPYDSARWRRTAC
jgi:hypothetical protein